MDKDHNNKNQKGVSLIIALFIMIIILSVTLSISSLLYSEVKVMKNIGNAAVGFYAADSGVEKVLYYDRQVLPHNNDDCLPETVDADCINPPYTSCINGFCSNPSARGLCSMNNNCGTGGAGDTSAYCNGITNNPLVSGGCDLDKCNNCKVDFDTTFTDSSLASGVKYNTQAIVSSVACIFPSDCISGHNCTNGFCDNESNFEIDSAGIFGSAQRKIQIYIAPQ